MIRINLLAVERERPAKRAAGLTVGQRLTIACSVILVATAIGIVWWFWHLQQRDAQDRQGSRERSAYRRASPGRDSLEAAETRAQPQQGFGEEHGHRRRGEAETARQPARQRVEGPRRGEMEPADARGHGAGCGGNEPV